MSHADALRVAIRVRPLIERETRELKSVIAHSVQDKLQIAPGHAWISSEGWYIYTLQEEVDLFFLCVPPY
jgi:hypothetical protein